MRLAEFILHEMESVLAEWQAFAASLLPAAEGMTPLALRDHAQDILEAVAKDISTHQPREEQLEKSKGRAAKQACAPETAAQTHAVLRAQSGFDVNQLVAEYRTLRASVLRLWIDASPPDEPQLEEVIRFNEAIDQAITESVGHFGAQVEQYRNLFLGMLGHDMRSPLSAIMQTASYLAALNAGEQVSKAAGILIGSGASMQAPAGRSGGLQPDEARPGHKDCAVRHRPRRGGGRRVESVSRGVPEPANRALGSRRQPWLVGRPALAAAAPQPCLECNPIRVSRYAGSCDASRGGCQRLARSHEQRADDRSVGTGSIFDPLKRGSAQDYNYDRGSLGLGLFIVREIARAHGGEVEVHSRGGETTFAVRLPRHKRGAPS